MGLDKLRSVTPRRPGYSWFDMINADYRRRPDERQFNFAFKYREQAEVDHVGQSACVRIWTKPEVSPQWMIELNFLAPGGAQPPMTVFETNPNNYLGGWPEVEHTAESIFTGENLPDLKNTRLDFNAEVEGVSVHYFRDSLRVPSKRTAADQGKAEREEWRRRGVETIYLGKSPARLRVYDKIQELKFKGGDIGKLPEVLTRLEWELRGVRCPIDRFLDIPRQLPETKPFDKIQLNEVADYYDFKTDPTDSMNRLLYRAMVEKVGAQSATTFLNTNRHFSRRFKNIIVNNAELKAKIEESYQRSNARLLEGKAANIEYVYTRCGFCTVPLVDFVPCGGCGVRLCSVCTEVIERHDSKCPIRKENTN
jgi:hypothetical protein